MIYIPILETGLWGAWLEIYIFTLLIPQGFGIGFVLHISAKKNMIEDCSVIGD